MNASPFSEHRAREFVHILDERKRAIARAHERGDKPEVGEWPADDLARMLDQHTSPGHAMADRTPVSDPEHRVVGREWAGHDWHDEGMPGKRWFCFSHDAGGFWMYATDGSGHWISISEAAINRSFHSIYREPDGRLYCHWFKSRKVPDYTGQEFVRHKDVTVS